MEGKVNGSVMLQNQSFDFYLNIISLILIQKYISERYHVNKYKTRFKLTNVQLNNTLFNMAELIG